MKVRVEIKVTVKVRVITEARHRKGVPIIME